MRSKLQKRRDASVKAKGEAARQASIRSKGTDGSVNWEALKQKLKEHKAAAKKDQKLTFRQQNHRRAASQNEEDVRQRKRIKLEFGLERVVALDCEMVSISKDGHKERAAARIAIVYLDIPVI